MRFRMPFGARAAFVAVLAFLTFAPAAMAIDEVNTKKLRQNVTVNGILGHERALQRIANMNGGTRASGTPGYAASAAYVKDRLKKAGYKVSEQTFDFPFFQETAAPELERVSPDPETFATATFEYSGSGDVTEPAQAVDVIVPMDPASPPSTSTSGCEESDFAGFTAGNVALMQRGTCTSPSRRRTPRRPGQAPRSSSTRVSRAARICSPARSARRTSPSPWSA